MCSFFLDIAPMTLIFTPAAARATSAFAMFVSEMFGS